MMPFSFSVNPSPQVLQLILTLFSPSGTMFPNIFNSCCWFHLIGHDRNSIHNVGSVALCQQFSSFHYVPVLGRIRSLVLLPNCAEPSFILLCCFVTIFHSCSPTRFPVGGIFGWDITSLVSHRLFFIVRPAYAHIDGECVCFMYCSPNSLF